MLTATPKSKKRYSFGGFLSPAGSPKASPRGSPSFNRISSEERKRSFEDWLKIAADNKINGQNTWDLALIDYFADMSLLREGDSINFQKASYTLDGCVKVYTSRIDSVDSEAKKLLLGLAEKEEEVQEEQGETANPTKRRKQLAKTLSDNQSLSMEALELDFAADPLFQKTAADFDEGGAKGLLLSHLDIASDGRIIFDGSDFSNEPCTIPEGEYECDLAALKSQFGARLANIHSQLVCPTFSKFVFNSESNDDFQIENRDDFYYEPMDLSDHDDYGGPADMDDFPIYQDASNPFDGSLQPTTVQHSVEETELIDQNIMKIVQSGLIKTEGNMFSFFDTHRGTAWAGPEYWKARSLRKPTTEKVVKNSIKKKEKQVIDFLNAEPVDPKVLFAKSKTSTLLPKSKLKESFLLPEDHQYRSERLTKLFLRPDFTFQEFTEKVATLKQTTVNTMQPVQESNTGDYVYGADENGGPTFDDEPIYGGFDEDDDEVEYPTSLTLPTEANLVKPDAEMVDTSNLEYADQLVAEPVRLKSKPLMFAKTAKRVDVQKLKENLWTKIAEDPETLIDEKQVPEHVEKKFTDLVHEIDEYYPEKQRKDISVAFCFICVLHLANENNLKILGDKSMKDLLITN